MNQRVIALIIFVVVALGVLFYVSQNGRLKETPEQASQKKLDNILPIIGQVDTIYDSDGTPTLKYQVVAPFSFTNQEGRTITNADVKGKIYCANFFFCSCAEVCPKMQEAFKQEIYEVYKDNPNVVFLSHTVDPEADSVSILKAYKEDYLKVHTTNWHFLTGNQKELYTMCQKSYFLAVEQKSEDFIHSQEISLVDQQGRVRAIYDSHDPKALLQLKEDIKTLLTTLH